MFEGFDSSVIQILCADLRKKMNPAINASDNRLSSGQGYSFDTSGNMTRDVGDRKFTYDAENKQVKVESLRPERTLSPARSANTSTTETAAG